jgi:hypothetical protein
MDLREVVPLLLLFAFSSLCRGQNQTLVPVPPTSCMAYVGVSTTDGYWASSGGCKLHSTDCLSGDFVGCTSDPNPADWVKWPTDCGDAKQVDHMEPQIVESPSCNTCLSSPWQK